VTGGPLSYDAAGNVINDGSHNYTYDAANQLTQVDGGSTASYVYDGSGRRVVKTADGTTVQYIYDLSGRVLTEESSAGQWNRGEVYAGGQHLVTYRHDKTYFIAADALGTERIRSTLDHTSYESCMNLPFGDGLTCTGTAVGEVSPLHFTGKERDAEDTVSGNDYFGARFYASNFGRFMSPDPSGGHLMNPQSLNRYAYVHNSPLNMIDPTGLDCVYLNGGGTSTETVLRGDCISDTDNGVFVAGRVDVGEGAILNSGTDTLSFAYTPSGTNSSVTYNGEAPDPTAASYFSPNFNSDVPLNPFAQGVSSQLNAMPIAKFVHRLRGVRCDRSRGRCICTSPSRCCSNVRFDWRADRFGPEKLATRWRFPGELFAGTNSGDARGAFGIYREQLG
jgi:RHS repeat-associated protein